MAKPFKHPQIKALEVNQSCTVFGNKAAIKRSADEFGKRNNRRFAYQFGEVSHVVTRLPDPVAEQSEAA